MSIAGIQMSIVPMEEQSQSYDMVNLLASTINGAELKKTPKIIPIKITESAYPVFGVQLNKADNSKEYVFLDHQTEAPIHCYFVFRDMILQDNPTALNNFSGIQTESDEMQLPKVLEALHAGAVLRKRNAKSGIARSFNKNKDDIVKQALNRSLTWNVENFKYIVGLLKEADQKNVPPGQFIKTMNPNVPNQGDSYEVSGWDLINGKKK